MAFDTFDRFTDRARRAVALADQASARMLHDTTDTGHLLLGLIGEGGGTAFAALDALGVTAETAGEAVLRRRPAGDTHPTAHRPFTPRLEKALELALREALQLGCNYVGTEHLLLGLIREGGDTGVQALVACREDADFPSVVRAKVLELLRGYAEAERRAKAPKPVLTLDDGAEVARLFASWAQREGILSRVTEDQCALLARAFMTGFAYGAGRERGETIGAEAVAALARAAGG